MWRSQDFTGRRADGARGRGRAWVITGLRVLGGVRREWEEEGGGGLSGHGVQWAVEEHLGDQEEEAAPRLRVCVCFWWWMEGSDRVVRHKYRGREGRRGNKRLEILVEMMRCVAEASRRTWHRQLLGGLSGVSSAGCVRAGLSLRAGRGEISSRRRFSPSSQRYGRFSYSTSSSPVKSPSGWPFPTHTRHSIRHRYVARRQRHIIFTLGLLFCLLHHRCRDDHDSDDASMKSQKRESLDLDRWSSA